METKLYDRQKGEPAKVYNRFLRFLHSNRNLSDFAGEEGITLGTAQQNSCKWNWKERSIAWDKDQDAIVFEQVEKEFVDLNVNGLYDMKSFISTLNNLKEDVLLRFESGDINSSTCMNIMSKYVDCYRQATELYYINCRKPLVPPEEKEEYDINPLSQLGEAILRSTQRIKDDTV